MFTRDEASYYVNSRLSVRSANLSFKTTPQLRDSRIRLRWDTVWVVLLSWMCNVDAVAAAVMVEVCGMTTLRAAKGAKNLSRSTLINSIV